MAGLLDNLVKGLSTLAPQDDPDVKIFNAQNELKELSEKEETVYAELGRKLYEENGREQYPAAAVQLDALDARRTAVQEQIAQIKEEKAARERAAQAAAEAESACTCPNCGAVNPENTRFCPECGFKLESEQKKFCTGCGAELKPGMQFCTECGTKVS